MSIACVPSAPATLRLDEILLGHLLANWPWPGGDGLTADAVLSCYPRAAALGHVPGHRELERLYPERHGELQSLYERQEWGVK
jgi:hypothetical protein